MRYAARRQSRMTLYDIKPAFQKLLRPVCGALAKAGITANQVTIGAMLLSIATGTALAVLHEERSTGCYRQQHRADRHLVRRYACLCERTANRPEQLLKSGLDIVKSHARLPPSRVTHLCKSAHTAFTDSAVVSRWPKLFACPIRRRK